MQNCYIITQLDTFHLMYDVSSEYPIYLTEGDVQQQVDFLNSTHEPVTCKIIEETLPLFSYRKLQTNIPFLLPLGTTNYLDFESEFKSYPCPIEGN